MKESKGFSSIELLMLLVVVAVVSSVGWFVVKSKTSVSKNYEAATKAQDGVKAPNKSDAKQADPQLDKQEPTSEYPRFESRNSSVAPKFIAFKNSDMGVQFSYPDNWGDATVKKGIHDVTQETGQGYLVTFSKNPYVFVGIKSRDYSFNGPGMDGHSVGFNVFSLLKDIYKDAVSDSYIDYRDTGADKLLVDEANVQVRHSLYQALLSGYFLEGIVKFNKSKVFAGIEFYYEDLHVDFGNNDTESLNIINAFKKNDYIYLSKPQLDAFITTVKSTEEL